MEVRLPFFDLLLCKTTETATYYQAPVDVD